MLPSRVNQVSRRRELAGLLSTDQEMIPAMNMINAPAQNFVTNDEMLTPVLKAFVQYGTHYTLHEVHDVFRLCVLVEHSVASTSSSTAKGTRPSRTHRVSGGIAQLFLNLGTRRGCVVSITPQPPLPPGKTPVPIAQEAGWAPGTGLDRCGKSRPTGFRSPDLPATPTELSQPPH